MKETNCPVASIVPFRLSLAGGCYHRFIPVVAAVLALGGDAAGQTTYSPGGIGTVGSESLRGNTITSVGVFAWDIDANSTASGFDTYSGGGRSTLEFNEFRVILGPTVDFNQTFWQTNMTWASILTAKGAATITNHAAGVIYAYTYSGGNYTAVDHSSYGSFSMTGNTLNWSAVPEPGSALAGFLILGGLSRRRRR